MEKRWFSYNISILNDTVWTVIDQNQQPERRRLRLLIVDDSAAARSGMKALLETVTSHEKKLKIFEAANGQEVLEFVETIQPDIVLMDAKMPMLNGIEATRIIKERWPNIRVVVITMYPAYERDAKAAGADIFLLKGCTVEELFAAIFQWTYNLLFVHEGDEMKNFQLQMRTAKIQK